MIQARILDDARGDNGITFDALQTMYHCEKGACRNQTLAEMTTRNFIAPYPSSCTSGLIKDIYFGLIEKEY